MMMDTKTLEDIRILLDSYKEAPSVRISDLLILGLLSYRNLSGYDIYKFIEQKADVSSSILKLQKATVYNTLSRMTEEGYVTVVKRTREHNRPIKSIYGLTEQGKTHLQKLLQTNMVTPPILYVNFYLDVTLYHVLPKEDIQSALYQKIDQVQTLITMAQLYAQQVEGTISGVLLESEVNMLHIIRGTLETLTELIETTDINELYQIGEIDQSKILDNMRMKRRVEHD
jgi:DNA-binding PadR family transcriptional regulator